MRFKGVLLSGMILVRCLYKFISVGQTSLLKQRVAKAVPSHSGKTYGDVISGMDIL